MHKTRDLITVQDFAQYPVWRIFEGPNGEIRLSPVQPIPVKSLDGCVVGCLVTLHNGQQRWAVLSNIHLDKERLTRHVLLVSVERGARWLTLSRYFDVDYDRNGPEALSKSLGLPVAEVFPITYDIRRFVIGTSPAAQGAVYETPIERLSKKELMDLSLQ